MKHRVLRTTTDKLENELNRLQRDPANSGITPVFQGGRDWTVLFRELPLTEAVEADPGGVSTVRVSLSWEIPNSDYRDALVHDTVAAFSEVVLDICDQEQLRIDGPYYINYLPLPRG